MFADDPEPCHLQPFEPHFEQELSSLSRVRGMPPEDFFYRVAALLKTVLVNLHLDAFTTCYLSV